MRLFVALKFLFLARLARVALALGNAAGRMDNWFGNACIVKAEAMRDDLAMQAKKMGLKLAGPTL